MPENGFEKIKSNLIAKLGGLSPFLTYHSVEHTLDLLEQCERIALEEGITNERELLLLKVAALYHDCGFLETYSEHEKKGCEIFLEDAADFDFNDKEKNTICGLIMATRIPQQPRTLMEKVICDADLDYLGRRDFFKIGDSLRREFLHYKIVHNNYEWEKLQLKFLQNHKYHTKASQKQREPGKQRNLSKLLVV
ncbi:MAG TPA: HD domain-containing protein [Chitinophagaceae bacterium]|nr:HD domain-containing protein [Chitinophagaceae bacterium]